MLEHNANSSKTQTEAMVFTGSNSYWCLSKSVEKKLDQQTVVFIVTVNQDKYKMESSRILKRFLRQRFSSVTKLKAMLCISLTITAAANSIAASLYVHILRAQKKASSL